MSMVMKGWMTCQVNKLMVKTLPRQVAEPRMEAVSTRSINTYVVTKWYSASKLEYV